MAPQTQKIPKMPVPIKITSEEILYRLTRYPESSAVPTARLNCTKCKTVIKPRMVTDQNIHPILQVLLCRKCRYFYDQRQSTPNQTHCKWCANQQNLHDCSACAAKFCEGCIIRNVFTTIRILVEIKEKKWKCFQCFTKPIWDERAICAQAKAFAENCNKELKERIARCSFRQPGSSMPNLGHVPNLSGIKNNPLGEQVRKTSNTSEETKQEACDIENGEKNLPEHCNKNKAECVICLQNAPTMLLYPCGHKCLCKPCSTLLSLREKRCPLCRKNFTDIIRMYE